MSIRPRSFPSLQGNSLINTSLLRAAGAVAVTVPTCWFLISNKPESSHGHGGHGDSHGAHAEEHEEEEQKSEEEEKPEEKEDDKPAESEEKPEEKEEPKKSDESDSDDETKDQDTPATSDDESVVGETDKNVRKSVPDAKGGNKARLESKAAVKQGEDNSEGKEGEPSDKVCWCVLDDHNLRLTFHFQGRCIQGAPREKHSIWQTGRSFKYRY